MHGMPVKFPYAFSAVLVTALITPVVSSGLIGNLDLETEVLSTSDVDLYTGTASGTFSLNDSLSLDLSLKVARSEVSYRPTPIIDPFGRDSELSDNLVEGSLSLTYAHQKSEFSLTGTGYDGFRSYTSMWIDEYYRQQYGSVPFSGANYEKPDPKGYGIDLAWRRELIPASGYLTISAAYLRDRIAPGYEIEDLGTSFGLIRGETHLDTWTAAVEYEGVINRTMRTRHVLRLTDTTTRELRKSWSGALNISLGTRWIARTTASYAIENPDFDAWSVSQSIDYEINDHWTISLTARYYEDTGQIEQANLISSAAPALTTRQAYLTLRRMPPGSNTGFSISAGPYLTRYAEAGIGTERFENLYSDRDWWWGRVAYSHTF
jgi:hypothetical protein